MVTYKLFKGFKKLGEFSKISEAKKEAEKYGDGVFNLISENYRTSWQVLNGVYYGD